MNNNTATCKLCVNAEEQYSKGEHSNVGKDNIMKTKVTNTLYNTKNDSCRQDSIMSLSVL